MPEHNRDYPDKAFHPGRQVHRAAHDERMAAAVADRLGGHPIGSPNPTSGVADAADIAHHVRGRI